MARAYPLYFDHPPVDHERRIKQSAAVIVIALHALLLTWALRTHPYIAPAVTSLVVVQLNGLVNAVFPDHVKHDITPKQASSKPAASAAKIAGQQRDALAAGGIHRRVVLEGAQRSGAADSALPLTGSLLADADSAGGGAMSNAAAGGRGSIFGRFHPPQVIHRARLAYPHAALAANEQGDVDVLITVAADGQLLDARVDRSSGSAALDEAAVASVRGYEFRAAQRDDQPVQAQAIINIEWRITPRERFEFAHLPKPADVHLDAEVKALEFLGNAPPRRTPCEKMKNPDCVADDR